MHNEWKFHAETQFILVGNGLAVGRCLQSGQTVIQQANRSWLGIQPPMPDGHNHVAMLVHGGVSKCAWVIFNEV